MLFVSLVLMLYRTLVMKAYVSDTALSLLIGVFKLTVKLLVLLFWSTQLVLHTFK